MTGHDDRVLSVASDSHGNLCTSSLDKSVRLWKPTLSSKTENLCHDDQVNFTSVSRDGNYLLTGSRWEFGFMYSLFYVQIFYAQLFFPDDVQSLHIENSIYCECITFGCALIYIQHYINTKKQIYFVLLKLYFSYITDSKVQHPFTYRYTTC